MVISSNGHGTNAASVNDLSAKVGGNWTAYIFIDLPYTIKINQNLSNIFLAGNIVDQKNYKKKLAGIFSEVPQKCLRTKFVSP